MAAGAEPEDLSVVLIEPSTISTPIWEKAIERLDALLRDGDPRIAGYRDRLTSFQESLRAADEHGQDPEEVAKASEQALTEKRPSARYVVGASGKLATALRPLIQDRLADRLGEATARS